MQIELRSIDSITPYAQNPRKNDGAVNAVAKSIAEFGFRVPLVIDQDGVVITGHTRLKAARQLGLTQVPVHVAHELTPEQARAYRLADNRLNEIAEWDDELLSLELQSLKDLGVDLNDLGWSDDDLTSIFAPAENAGVAEPDDVPEVIPAVTRGAGDLWLLGEHRLFCGSSTVLKDVQRVMKGKKAALIATDPPYLVDYTGDRPNDSGKDWSDTYREIDIKDADGFFTALFTNVLEVIAPKAAIYCWHAHRRCGLIQAVWEKLGILDHQQIIWVKPTSLFGRVYWHFRHEPCLMGWKKGSLPEHDGGHEFNSVWEIDWEGKSRIIGNEHPTQKPVEIFARPMRKHTQRGDICFEPFSGSGSQLIAAEQLGRRCHAIELEPVFVDVAVRRWQQYTGKQAVLEGTKKTWEQVAKERGVNVVNAVAEEKAATGEVAAGKAA